ncbi:MAG: hypothetical protein KA368_08245 [Acidobacteria bacterium]|nr:hypothetical protein [Acidobacteriota bacterium]
MKIRFKKRVGDMEFEIEDEAATQSALFGVVEFWSCLPTEGPGGEKDLRFAHRQAQDFDFYEIVSDKAGQRFCFGQRKGKGHEGELFPKGWEPVFSKDGQSNGQPEDNQRRQTTDSGDGVACSLASWGNLTKVVQAAGKEGVMPDTWKPRVKSVVGSDDMRTLGDADISKAISVINGLVQTKQLANRNAKVG